MTRLSIFVHRASEHLTDYEAHGEGLICFSLLRGLVERGHQIFAYTNHAAIRDMPDRLEVRSRHHRVPANSLAAWEHDWYATRWLQQLVAENKIDLVWHMNPMGGSGCPRLPQTFGRPLAVGPLYYEWPKQPGGTPKSGRPRFGVGLQAIVGPIAERGWRGTLAHASQIFCATGPHAELVQRQFPNANVMALPVIVDPPPSMEVRPMRVQTHGNSARSVSLLFVANLTANKNPHIFCETIHQLRIAGLDVTGTLLGDGPERPALEAFCAANTLSGAVCFRGKVPNSEVYQALGEADFLVSTSLGEPYGRGIAEAMSVGTPAICHHSGGPADFISDGCDGLLAEELTAEAYAVRLKDALSDPSTWNQLSMAAYQKARAWRSSVVLDMLEQQLYHAVRGSHDLKR